MIKMRTEGYHQEGDDGDPADWAPSQVAAWLDKTVGLPEYRGPFLEMMRPAPSGGRSLSCVSSDP